MLAAFEEAFATFIETITRGVNLIWPELIYMLQLGTKELTIFHLKYLPKYFQASNYMFKGSVCAYQGVRNDSFSENFSYLLNGW